MKLRPDPYRRIWGASVAAVIGVHAIVIGSMLLRFSQAPDPNADFPAIAIEMALPTAPPTPVHDTPTPRQIEAPVPKPHPRHDPQPKKLPFEPPPPQPLDTVKPEVVVQAKKEETPAPATSQPLPPAPVTTQEAAPDLKPDNKTAALINDGASAGKATQIDLWNARILARIQLMKRYPPAAQNAGQQDDVDVQLAMDRDGNLLDAKVRGSRGYSLLDDAALDAVRRATPFPKPPREVEGEPILLSVVVHFFKKT